MFLFLHEPLNKFEKSFLYDTSGKFEIFLRDITHNFFNTTQVVKGFALVFVQFNHFYWMHTSHMTSNFDVGYIYGIQLYNR